MDTDVRAVVLTVRRDEPIQQAICGDLRRALVEIVGRFAGALGAKQRPEADRQASQPHPPDGHAGGPAADLAAGAGASLFLFFFTIQLLALGVPPGNCCRPVAIIVIAEFRNGCQARVFAQAR